MANGTRAKLKPTPAEVAETAARIASHVDFRPVLILSVHGKKNKYWIASFAPLGKSMSSSGPAGFAKWL